MNLFPLLFAIGFFLFPQLAHSVPAGDSSSPASNVISRISGFLNQFIGRYEAPPYRVIEDFGKFEEREYEADLNWACTETTVPNTSSNDNREIQSGQFWKLFKYISGENVEAQRIDMTVPVSTERRNLTALGETKRTMCFYIGMEHQTSPPTPTNSQVFIQKRPGYNVYTRRRGGYFNDAKWEAEKKALGILVQSQDLDYNQEFYFVNGYDSPWKFYNRRNEVWLVKE